jgi:DNA-binding transcriptional MerR regulator
MSNEHLLRIGELSRRTGVTPEVLRAWERRYHLFEPERTDGGFRLYSTSDVVRINTMKRLIGEGVAASEAARRVIAGAPGSREGTADAPSLFDQRFAEMRTALLTYDEAAAHAAIDYLLMEFDVERVMRSGFLPALAEIGQLWEEGRLSVAEEHFASNLVRRRLGALTRGWEDGVGPRALLACPPEEEHDIPLLMFGIALGNRGWRIAYLGARTPADDLVQAAGALRPDLVVLASPLASAFSEIIDSLRTLATITRVALAGAGATAEAADQAGALLLDEDPVTAASRVAQLVVPHGRRAR